jgi:hypothetical protein
MMALACSARNSRSPVESALFRRTAGQQPDRLRLEPLEERYLLSGFSSLLSPALPLLVHASAPAPLEIVASSVPASSGHTGEPLAAAPHPDASEAGRTVQSETPSATLPPVTDHPSPITTDLVQILPREAKAVPGSVASPALPPTPLPVTVSGDAVPLRLVRFPVLSAQHAPAAQVEMVAEVDRGEFSPILPDSMDLLPDEPPTETPLSACPVLPPQGEVTSGEWRVASEDRTAEDLAFLPRSQGDRGSVVTPGEWEWASNDRKTEDLAVFASSLATRQLPLATPGEEETWTLDTAAQAGLILALALVRDPFGSRSSEERRGQLTLTSTL